MPPTPNRRVTDKITEELLDLIKKEDREPEKGVLLILYQISELISFNANLVQEIHSTLAQQNKVFEAHRSQNLEYINKGKGAWKVLAIVLIAFKGLLVSAAAFAYFDYTKLKDKVTENGQGYKEHYRHHNDLVKIPLKPLSHK